MRASCTIARAALIGATSVLLLATCREDNRPATPLAPEPPAAPSFATLTSGQVLVGAGNVATCGNNNDEATAKLLDGIPGTVFADGPGLPPISATSEATPVRRGRAITATTTAPGTW